MRKLIFLMSLCLLVFLVSPARAYVLEVYTEPDDIQDDWNISGWAHELGNQPPFPADEWITSSWEDTDLTACPEAPGDDPYRQNVLVTITNMSGRDWGRLVYVAYVDTGLTNWDERVGQVGNQPCLAFMIDKVGINQPLVYESIAYDNKFEAGETWKFIIQDYGNAYGRPASEFGRLGIIGDTSSGSETGSIITPEPATLVLLGLGGLLLCRRKK